MCRRAEQRLRCEVESVPAGRHFVESILEEWGVRGGDPAVGALFDIRLVVSELLTNAVRFCHREISLHVAAHADHVEVAVTDDSPAPLRRGLSAGADATSGRGLAMVAQLSREWGERPWDGTSKQVWSRIPVPTGSRLATDCSRAAPA